MKVAIIGSGSWGTALAAHISKQGAEVCIYARRAEVATYINVHKRNPEHVPEANLELVRATHELDRALEGAELVIIATPSQFVRDSARRIAQSPSSSGNAYVLVVSKGIEAKTAKLMHEVIESELSCKQLMVLSGPNHAEEISVGKIACAVLACKDKAAAQEVQALLNSETFRIYISQDIQGVELCGALKNVVAIAAGMGYGLGVGDNAIAALMTRGLAEMSRGILACGGDALTGLGLAGMGDLVATCTSKHSRNRSFGEALITGADIKTYEQTHHVVVEGARACVSAADLAQSHKLELPICEMVRHVLYEGLDPKQGLEQLMQRTPKEELWGMPELVGDMI